VAPAQAVARQEWFVVKMGDSAYAFDASGVYTDVGHGVRSVSIHIGTPAGSTLGVYNVDCGKTLGLAAGSIASDDEKKTEELVMVEGNAKPTDPGWSAISRDGSMKIAADVACGRAVTGAIRVKSEQAALKKLKTLSK
jgi:hypothetical protein